MYDDLFKTIDIPIIKVRIINNMILILEHNEKYVVEFGIKEPLKLKTINKLISQSDEYLWMKEYLLLITHYKLRSYFANIEKHYEISKVPAGLDEFYFVHKDRTKEVNLEDRLYRTQKIGKIGDWENDMELNNQKWSDEIFNLLGENAGEFTESYERFMSYIHPDDYENVKIVNDEALVERKEYSQEFRIIDKNKDVKWMLSRGKFEFNDKNEVKKVYGMMQDITVNKRLEMLLIDALDKAERISKNKSEFLAMVSHEIRTPLTAILGMAKLLLNNELDMLSSSYVKNIIDSGNILLDLVNDILDLSKIESGKIELDMHPFDMRYLINNLSNIFEGRFIEKNIDFKIFMDELVPNYLIGDNSKIRQILMNLIGNSIKFTDKGVVELSVNVISIFDNNVKLHIAVKDTGIGISEDKLETIFDSYSQEDSTISRRFGGTGLGLAISKHYIELMDGCINVKSKLGVGSTFEFEIVLAKSSRKSVEVEEDFFEPLFLSESIKVLVAEDDKINQIYFKTFLKQAYNFDVTVVDDGQYVLNEIEKNKYEIVFLDSNMINLGGIETAKRIRSLDDANKDLCLVALTAEALKGDEERFLNAGFDYYVTKPIDEESFSVVIKNILKSNKLVLSKSAFKAEYDESDISDDFKYLTIEGIEEKSNFLGDDYFNIIMEYAIEEYSEKYSRILDNIENRDLQQIYYEIHSMKGTLYYFSNSILTDIILEVEAYIKDGDSEKALSTINELLTIFPVFIDELEELLIKRRG